MAVIAALLCGLLFGAGLSLSQMIDPARVLGFLDVAGHWDPALAFVMGGALIPAAAGFARARRLSRPALAAQFALPEKTPIDARLMTGAVLFGIGWGLVGLCPGPALTNLATGLGPVLLFVAAMTLGMALYAVLSRRSGGVAHVPTRS